MNKDNSQGTAKSKNQKEIVGFTIEGKSLTVEILEKEVLIARKRIESVQYLRHEDLENEVKVW